MFGRRLVILVAVLMGLTALAASVEPPPQTRRQAATPSPTPTPTATIGAPPAAVTEVVARRLSADPPPGPLVRVRARVGSTVELEVAGDVVDAVEVVGLPAIEPIDPSTPARLELYPDSAGTFPIRLQDAGRNIALLEVTRTG